MIEAVYSGSAALLPSTSPPVQLMVPARISLSIRPRALPWNGVLTVRGRLQGGFVPPDGVALRLLVRYPGSSAPSSLLALRTNARGRFRIKWSYHGGRGVARYPFSIATTAAESDYPFAPSRSRQVRVTFGA